MIKQQNYQADAREAIFMKIISIIISLGLLASCGGGGGGTSSSTTLPPGSTNTATQVINGFTVPVAPDPVANNATLTGVDSNNNGVRDDVEISLAQKALNQADFSAALKYANAQQILITSTTPKTRDEALILYGKLLCSTNGSSSFVKTLEMKGLTANNDERKLALRKIEDLVVGFGGEELSSCN